MLDTVESCMLIADSKSQAIAKLSELLELYIARYITSMDKAARIKEIMTPIQDKLEAVEAEFDPLLSIGDERVAILEAEIKSLVVQHGATIAIDHLQAVFSKGAVRWDADALKAAAKSNSTLEQYRKQATPSASIKRV